MTDTRGKYSQVVFPVASDPSITASSLSPRPIMPKFTCPGNKCGQTYTTQRGLSVHIARCSKYKLGVKHQLTEHKKRMLEDERPVQAPPTQAGVTGLSDAGGTVLEREASHSGVDYDTEQVNLVCIHRLDVTVGHATDTIIL